MQETSIFHLASSITSLEVGRIPIVAFCTQLHFFSILQSFSTSFSPQTLVPRAVDPSPTNQIHEAAFTTFGLARTPADSDDPCSSLSLAPFECFFPDRVRRTEIEPETSRTDNLLSHVNRPETGLPENDRARRVSPLRPAAILSHPTYPGTRTHIGHGR